MAGRVIQDRRGRLADEKAGERARFVGTSLTGGTLRRACPADLWPVARRKLTQLNRVSDLRELSVPPGNRLERLEGERSGQHSIRINEQYRICFGWEDGYADAVEVTDYH